MERALRSEGLTPHVRIVPGWFHESLPPKGLRSIAMLRLDGDTFNGTYEALRRLYPLVVEGGIVYVDDAGSYRGAAVALRELRLESDVVAPWREDMSDIAALAARPLRGPRGVVVLTQGFHFF